MTVRQRWDRTRDSGLVTPGSVTLHAVAFVVLAVLVLLAVQGGLALYVALAGAAGIAVLAVLGLERTGLLVLVGAYFTAPFYKGVAPSPESLVTATDGLLFLGFALLVPRLLRGRVRLPLTYLAGIMMVACFGLIGSLLSDQVTLSILSLTLWLIVMAGLPIAFALLEPDGRIVDLLAGTYVAGQVFSLGLGIVKGNEALGRQAGLSTQPNYLAQAGMISLCLLFFLWFRHAHRSWQRAFVLLAAVAVCMTSVVMSGSRAGTLVVAVLIVMIPIAERSAITGFVLSVLLALFVVALPLVIDVLGDQSSIARLAGGDSATASNAERQIGLSGGLARFAENPLFGSGLVDLYEIHNNFVEVAVGIGLFGLVGYLLVLFAFASPLFGTGEYRRLSYVVWGYIGFGATVPSLYDRSVWSAVALSAVAMWSVKASSSTRAGAGLSPDAGPAPRPVSVGGRGAVTNPSTPSLSSRRAAAVRPLRPRPESAPHGPHS